MDFAAAATLGLFLYQGNLEQKTRKKEKCILMTAVQLCDGCLTRRNASRPALRSCGHHWLNVKIDNGPISLFIVASLCLKGFLSHIRTLMFKVTGLKLQCVRALLPCANCLTSHMRQAVMSDVANIQPDPKPSECTGVLVNTIRF